MDQKRWKKIESVLDKALDMDSSDHQTEKFIRRSCKNDEQLYEQVIQLFRSVKQADKNQFLVKDSHSSDYKS